MMDEVFRHVYGVILAGGTGTRLWPLSTKQNPKQFLSVGLNDSLIGQTAARLLGFLEKSQLRIVCGPRYAQSLGQYLPMIEDSQIFVEPQPKNTAAALALAAYLLSEQDPEAVMIVAPADHLILPESWESFGRDARFAAKLALERDALVTFGIRPSYPATGFGYLEAREPQILESRAFYELSAFHEKPDLPLAEKYCREERYFWNSGIFVWKASAFLRALAKTQPDMHREFERLKREGYSEALLQEIFRNISSISVDYAVMEKAGNILMVLASFQWDDVGSLTAFAKALPPDGAGNCKSGDAYFVDAKNNLIISQTKPIALVGVEDLIVVETEKALLVVSKAQAQDVKKMVDLLEKQSRHDLL